TRIPQQAQRARVGRKRRDRDTPGHGEWALGLRPMRPSAAAAIMP
ncbi:hypothetical protein Y032_1592g3925, partial [Ancylostoma ceylanicum]